MKKNKKPTIVKETAEERAERIRMWAATRTRFIPSKKEYNRRDFKRITAEV